MGCLGGNLGGMVGTGLKFVANVFVNIFTIIINISSITLLLLLIIINQLLLLLLFIIN